MASLFTFLAAQGFVTLFLVLGFGHLVGRVKLGFFSPGSTAGALLVGLLVGSAAYSVAGVRFAIPDLLTTFCLALFTYAVGLRVGPQFVEGLRKEGVQLLVLVMVTTTTAFAMAFFGGRMLGLAPGLSAGILSGANTISAVMGVATAAVDQGLYQVPAGLTAEQVKANIAAGYSLSYILSILGIVLLVRNLPSMFGYEPIAAAREAEKKFGAEGHALPGTTEAFDLEMPSVGVRVFQLTNDAYSGRPVLDVFDRLDMPVLRVTRGGSVLPLAPALTLQKGDLLTVAGPRSKLIEETLGPEIADERARHFDIDQAELVLAHPDKVGGTVSGFEHSRLAYGIRLRALFRGGHELALLPGTPLMKHDVLRIAGPAAAVARTVAALGQAVRPTNATDIITLAFAIGLGYAVGLVSVRVAGIPVGLGAMGGVVVAGMLVSIVRSINPVLGGPMPEGARAFLESIGVDLFVSGLGLNVAPALVTALSQGMSTLYTLLLGMATAVVPTLISYAVGLYVLRMDPILLAGAVAGSRNSTTAMRAISERAKSTVPAMGYPVTYAASTVVFLVYGYLVMVLS